jgi:hypothetical protein
MLTLSRALTLTLNLTLISAYTQVKGGTCEACIASLKQGLFAAFPDNVVDVSVASFTALRIVATP